LHELQIASELLGAVKETLKNYPDALSVDSIDVTIGKLSFAAEEQIRFCWSVITEEDPVLKGSEMNVTHEEGMVKCKECGFEGELSMKEDPAFHYFLPVFACPKCGGSVDILKGKDVKITNVKVIMEDGD